MTAITYTLTNTNTTDNIEIRYFTFVDDANASHVADLSGVGGTGGYTENNTLKVRDKTYDTGGYLKKRYTNDSHTRIGHYSTHTGSTLTLKNDTGYLTDYPNGVQAGWVVDQTGSPFDGLTVTNVISNTSLVMSGPPAFLPTVGESIEFSTTTYVVILQNTTGLAPGWAITDNGYTPPPSGAPAYIINVIDSTHIQVNRLPDTTPIYNNSAYTYFTSSTNFLTLNESTANLGTGYSASGNGYDGSQSIISIVDGNTVIMSDLPGSVPTSGDTITFTDQAAQYILPPLGFGSFTVDYTTPTSLVGTNYPGSVTAHARKGILTVTKTADTFVNIIAPAAPPVIPTPPTYGGGTGGGGGSGGGGGQSWTVVTKTYDDGSTLTTVTNDQTGQSYTITTNALPGALTSDAEGGLVGDNQNGSDQSGFGAGGWGGGTTSPYGGSQGDGGACYLAGAKIAMADGRSINIEDVKVGEFVIGAFGEINQVSALKHVTLGSRKLYKINQEHDTTHEEIHISSDKNMYSIDTAATYGEYGLYWKCILGDGTEKMVMNFGVHKERLRNLHEGVELQSINGPRLLTSIEEYDLPEDTKLYNFVLTGSHTFFVNGYAVASFPREDDFDYDQWKSKVN